MIIEGICGFVCDLLYGLFSLFQLFSLPVDLINTLSTVLQDGTWAVGADILLLFTGCITFWWGVKLSIGIGIWVYEHLPLT